MNESHLFNTVWDQEWKNILSETDESTRKLYIATYPNFPQSLNVINSDGEHPLVVVPLTITRYITVMHIAGYLTIAELLKNSIDVTIIWNDLIARHDPQVRTRHKPSIASRRSKHEAVLNQILKSKGVSDDSLDYVLESELYSELMEEPDYMDIYRSFPFHKFEKKSYLDEHKHQIPWISETQNWEISPHKYGTFMQNMQSMLTSFLHLFKRVNMKKGGKGGKGAIMVGLEKSHIICRMIEGFEQLSNSKSFSLEVWVPTWKENIIPLPQNTSIKDWQIKDDMYSGRSYYLDTIIRWSDEAKRKDSQIMKRNRQELLYHAKCLGCYSDSLIRVDGEKMLKKEIINHLEEHASQYKDLLEKERNDRKDFSGMIAPMTKHGLTLLKVIVSQNEVGKYYNLQEFRELVKCEGDIKVGRLVNQPDLEAAVDNLEKCKFLEKKESYLTSKVASWKLSSFYLLIK